MRAPSCHPPSVTRHSTFRHFPHFPPPNPSKMMKTHPANPPPPRCRFCSSDNPARAAPSKSNITAERLTLLPGFLSKRRSSTEDEQPPVRRSWRLCKKNQPVTVSGYFSKLLAEGGSRSVFKDVKKKWKEENVDDEFGRRILDTVRNFELKGSDFYRNLIRGEIEAVNSKLLGKSGRNMSVNRKRAYVEEEKENYPMKFPHIPPSSWVFQTPPNRKLNYNHAKVDDNAMKPAVIETRNEKKVVYEMNRKINVDLSGFSNRQEIEIDKRYMMDVAGPSLGEQDDDDVTDDKMDFLQTDPFELENHFLSLTCRPKKMASALPRFSTLKRKRDIFEPQPGCSTDDDYGKPTVCFIDSLNLGNGLEESFTFKFTSSDSAEGSTTGHLFDHEGNRMNTFNLRL